jgi:hypothetical protein
MTVDRHRHVRRDRSLAATSVAGLAAGTAPIVYLAIRVVEFWGWFG